MGQLNGDLATAVAEASVSVESAARRSFLPGFQKGGNIVRRLKIPVEGS